MTEEANSEPASEEHVDTGQVEQAPPPRQVPLEALEAERHKRQEAERRAAVLEEFMLKQQQPAKVEDDDDNDLVNKGELKKFKQNHEKLTKEELGQLKREIAEDTFREVNPGAMKQINMHLKEILERKPWLVQSIESATNRYARAYEIVQDYMPNVAAKSMASSDARRIVENAKKPGSPAANAKSANLSNVEYLRSIAGTKEFRDYRQKVLQGK